MKIHKSVIIACLTLVYGVSLCAQTVSGDSVKLYPEEVQRKKLIENTKVFYLGNRELTPSQDSVVARINQFYFDQFRHSQDPQSPYFMFMSKNAEMAMGLGGMVRMRGWFDWNGSIPANGFSPYAIPIPKNPADKRKLGGTPAGTSLFFTLLGHNSRFGDYMAYIECNFDGYNNVGFKLKHAYVTIGDWTAGYAPSTFSDPAAQPLTIDGAGPNGKISRTSILVRYMHTFKTNWTVAGSLELPSSKPATDDKYTANATDYVPDACVFGQYSWNRGLSHVRLSAMVRGINYRDLVSQRNRMVAGWGVQLSSMFKIIRPLTMYAVASFGQGHASYTGDLSGNSFDLVAKAGENGRLYAPSALALTWGAKYNFRPDLYACVALAQMRYLPRETPDNQQYKYGLYGAVNLFWEVTPRFHIGAEYLAGKRKNFDGSHANANRIDAMFMLSF